MADEDWKVLLAPFAELAWQMFHAIDGLPIDRLRKLLAACDKPTSTNCWFAIHDAAQIIRPMVKAELERQIQKRGPWAWAGIPQSESNEHL